MLSSFNPSANQLVELVQNAKICWAASMRMHGVVAILCQALLSLFGANLEVVVTKRNHASSRMMHKYCQMNREQTGATKLRIGSIGTLNSRNRPLREPIVIKKKSALTNTLLR